MKLRSWLFIITAIALMLSGCTQNAVPAEEPVIGIIDQNTLPVLTQDSGPSAGGRLSLFMTAPETLNPLYTKNLYIRQMSQFVFDPLFLDDEGKDAVPFLAESAVIRDDPLIVDIKLRDSILFHNGIALTSGDVAYTIDAILKVKDRSPYYANILNISSVKIIDRLSLRLVLNQPDDNLFKKLTFPILPESVFRDWPVDGIDPNLKLIGTGAFLFDSYDGSTLKLSRNSDWWYAKDPEGLGHPIWMYGMDFKVFAKESEMVEAFQKQQVDVAVIYDGNLDSYAKRTDILFNRFKGNRLEYLLLSNNGAENSRMANAAFRTILLKYLSWYAILDPLPGGDPAFQEVAEYGAEGIRINTEEAIRQLNELGMVYDEAKKTLYYYKDGARLPMMLRLKYNGLDIERQKCGEWIQKAFLTLGITVDLDKASEQDEKNLLASNRFDMMLLGCRIPLSSGIDETVDLLAESLGFGENNAVLLPLYSKSQAALFNSKIRGPRSPNWKNLYNGWMDWYLVQTPEPAPKTP